MPKKMLFIKTVAAVLSLVMTLSAFTVFTTERVIAVGNEDNIASDEPTTVAAYDTIFTQQHTPHAFTEGIPVGIRLNLGAPFEKISICMPTWSDEGTKFTLSIYKWDREFDITRETPPLVSEKIENHKDNGNATLSFDELAAGEYLICVDEFSGGRLGAWEINSKVGKGYCYDDIEEKRIDWQMTVTFTKTPVEAFLPVVSVANSDKYGNNTAPPEAVAPEDALVNTHKVMPDTWVFTDGLGRTSLTYDDVGGVKNGKTVSMFYWTWHVDLASGQPFNINDAVEEHPDAANDYDHEIWPKDNTAYFWNEPIWGYYRTDDAWVLRKQAELLANAGVDAIFTDNTNANYTWRSSYTPLYEAWTDALENGAVNAPKVSYLFPFAETAGSIEQIKNIYLDIYSRGKYQNLWFYWEDRPMIMAHKHTLPGKTNLQKEIDKYFTYRPGYAGYVNEDSTKFPGSWGWLSVTPQAKYYVNSREAQKNVVEQTTVGVALNHSYSLHSIASMNGVDVMGRSYTTGYEDRYNKEGDEASNWGYNFAEQWETAIEADPKMIFVTGWNEWTAGRNEEWAGTENGFPDQFNNEYSRDIEPTKGELKDHYYYQLVNYVRKYKGCSPIPTPSAAKSIDINGGAEQWGSVEPYFAAYIGNTNNRDAKGYGDLVYTETSGRNDIVGAQIARDDEYVYFHVECAENITPYTDKLWMNLYIDSDQSKQGWNTFEYVLNKSAASEKTLVLERFTADNDYAKTEKVTDAEYTVDGKSMTVKIAKTALGLTGNDFTLNFAWTDNVHDEGNYDVYSGDIMDFYISGDVAPGGRFKYSYVSTNENATVQEPTDTDTTNPGKNQPKDKDYTLAIAIGAGAVVIAVAVAAAVVIVRKRKK